MLFSAGEGGQSAAIDRDPAIPGSRFGEHGEQSDIEAEYLWRAISGELGIIEDVIEASEPAPVIAWKLSPRQLETSPFLVCISRLSDRQDLFCLDRKKDAYWPCACRREEYDRDSPTRRCIQ